MTADRTLDGVVHVARRIEMNSAERQARIVSTIPIKRMGRAEKVAEAVARLLARAPLA